MKKSIPGMIARIVFFVIAIVLIYAPIFVIFIMSFTKSYSLTSLGLGKGNFTFKWYQTLFSNDYQGLDIATRYILKIKSLKGAILNTFSVTIISTIVSTVFGTAFSIGIHSFTQKYRTTLMMLNNMPVINPDIVTGFLLLLVFVIGDNVLGIERGFGTVLVSHIFFSIPYVVLSVYPRLSQIDPNTYEAARDLGCTRFGAIVKAVIPSITSGILTGMMFAFTMSIDDYIITLLVSGTDFINVSTWIDARMRKGYMPKTVYAYNVIIFAIALIGIIVIRLIQKKKSQKEINN